MKYHNAFAWDSASLSMFAEGLKFISEVWGWMSTDWKQKSEETQQEKFPSFLSLAYAQMYFLLVILPDILDIQQAKIPRKQSSFSDITIVTGSS